MCGVCNLYLFLTSPSFDASGRLCFVIVAFHWYFHLYVCTQVAFTLKYAAHQETMPI